MKNMNEPIILANTYSVKLIAQIIFLMTLLFQNGFKYLN